MILSPQLVLLSWPLIILAIFSKLPAQKAVIVSFVVGWLFLPERIGFPLPGLPDYTRMSSTCYSIFIATLIFNFQKFKTYRFSWIDVPVFIYCICPLFSSISNGLGLYDGMSATLRLTVRYGFPYFIGRINLNSLAAIKKLTIIIFVSGLIYAPLCLYEARMSPQIHRIVYGYYGAPFAQQIRLGGFRPTVFMRHGLSVGMWMMAVTLIGLWLWQSGALKKFWNIPMSWLVLGLSVTLVLIKSTGAYIYIILGVAILFITKKFRTPLPLILLILSIILYLFVAATGSFGTQGADQVLGFLSQVFPEERISSLEYRLDNEHILIEKALERPLFGWGGWGRNRVFDYNWAGEFVDISTTDSMWVISYGVNGAVGLIGLYTASLLPSLWFAWRKYPARFWFHPEIAPAAVLAVVVTLYMVDCLLNGQYNPAFVMSMGALAGLVVKDSSRSFKKRKA